VIAPGQGTVTSESFGTITNFTTTGNTTLGDATTDTLTVGVTGIVKNSSGNVGIGTASPIVNLDVNSSAAGGNICAFRSTATNGGYVQFQGSGSTPTTTGYVGAASKLNTGGSVTDFGMTARTNLVFGTNDGTERMRISSAGYVGIGVTNPVGLGQLEVQAPSTGAGLWVQTGGTNSGYTIAEFRTGTNAPALQVYGDASSTFGGTISSNITPGKYTIDASNLGVGTSIANGGTVDFASASGMLVVNNWSNGGLTIYICGGGNTVNVSSVAATVGTFSYQASVNGYRWTNNYGSTATFGFFFVRTRSGA
jgi:hypothetical protein